MTRSRFLGELEPGVTSESQPCRGRLNSDNMQSVQMHATVSSPACIGASALRGKQLSARPVQVSMTGILRQDRIASVFNTYFSSQTLQRLTLKKNMIDVRQFKTAEACRVVGCLVNTTFRANLRFGSVGSIHFLIFLLERKAELCFCLHQRHRHRPRLST